LVIIDWKAWDDFLISKLFSSDNRKQIDPFKIQSFDFVEQGPVLLQINLTVLSNLPVNIEELVRRCKNNKVALLNQQLMDISKREIQSRLDRNLRPESLNGENLVIVKTNMNWGGEIENRLGDNLNKLHIRNMVPPSDFGASSYYVKKLKEV